MSHLTERELIEYRFALGRPELAARVEEHLDECAECKAKLEELKRRFTALDLLGAEEEVSEGLVAQVLAEAGRPIKRGRHLLALPAWVSAAAAVLVIGAALVVSHTAMKRPQRVEQEGIVKDLGHAVVEKPSEKIGVGGDRLVAANGDAVKEGFDEHAYAWWMGEKTDRPEALSVNGEAAGEVAEAEKPGMVAGAAPLAEMGAAMDGDASVLGVPEKAPFAPASAIELVVLPKRDNVQITIYNSADMTLVRERRELTLKRGWNWLQFMWANTLIDPTSLSLEAMENKDKIEVEQLVYPARLKDVGRWLIRSEVEGKTAFEITYLTSGLSWRAFYMGTLAPDERNMELKGYVRVTNNSGEDYEEAQTRLIVGQVHQLDRIAELAKRQYPYGSPVERAGGESRWLPTEFFEGAMRGGYAGYGLAPIMEDLERKSIEKEGLSEYFLYTIEGTESIENGWSKRLLSLDKDEVPVVNLYKYEEERYGKSVVRFLSFKNDEEHEMGETPIPGGMLKVYRNVDEEGYLGYVGQSAFKYIPVDEDVELNLGAVEDIVVEPKLMEFSTENYTFDRRGNIDGWDEIREYSIEVRNTRDMDVKVEIKRNFNTSYWKLRTKSDYEKEDLDTVKFSLKLEPRSNTVFEYTVRTYHGERQEAWSE